MADYKGMTRAEVRALVLKNNKNKDQSDNSRLSMSLQLSEWRRQNKKSSTSKTTKNSKSSKKSSEKKEGSRSYGQKIAVNKDLLRDATYSDYARSINNEAPVEGLYKSSATPKKRGYVMKRNRK
tara:strand:+ start:102 stop:473 length:372 start_codon:yes stop_codon:yes gene_type:complete